MATDTERNWKMEKPMKAGNAVKAVVVLSGGQGSATALALAVKRHGALAVAAITFSYGLLLKRSVDSAISEWNHPRVWSTASEINFAGNCCSNNSLFSNG